MELKIERVTRYRVDGKEFETVAKAKDYVDGKVNSLLQGALLSDKLNMLTVSDIVRLTEILLENRDYLAYLLSVELPDDED